MHLDASKNKSRKRYASLAVAVAQLKGHAEQYGFKSEELRKPILRKDDKIMALREDDPHTESHRFI